MEFYVLKVRQCNFQVEFDNCTLKALDKYTPLYYMLCYEQIPLFILHTNTHPFLPASTPFFTYLAQHFNSSVATILFWNQGVTSNFSQLPEKCLPPFIYAEHLSIRIFMFSAGIFKELEWQAINKERNASAESGNLENNRSHILSNCSWSKFLMVDKMNSSAPNANSLEN